MVWGGGVNNNGYIIWKNVVIRKLNMNSLTKVLYINKVSALETYVDKNFPIFCYIFFYGILHYIFKLSFFWEWFRSVTHTLVSLTKFYVQYSREKSQQFFFSWYIPDLYKKMYVTGNNDLLTSRISLLYYDMLYYALHFV